MLQAVMLCVHSQLQWIPPTGKISSDRQGKWPSNIWFPFCNIYSHRALTPDQIHKSLRDELQNKLFWALKKYFTECSVILFKQWTSFQQCVFKSLLLLLRFYLHFPLVRNFIMSGNRRIFKTTFKEVKVGAKNSLMSWCIVLLIYPFISFSVRIEMCLNS